MVPLQSPPRPMGYAGHGFAGNGRAGPARSILLVETQGGPDAVAPHSVGKRSEDLKVNQ